MSDNRTTFDYDLCIVGAGMVGSAAARYASMDPNVKVCLVGPQEPKDRTCVRGDEIFGTHYDNGRLACRTEHVDPFWANLARASIKEYRNIERLSVGYMSIGCKTYLNKHKNTDFIKLSNTDLRERLGYMTFGYEDNALLDEQGGWINPRKLVDAEILIASKQGCDVIRDVVSEITEYVDGRTSSQARDSASTLSQAKDSASTLSQAKDSIPTLSQAKDSTSTLFVKNKVEVESLACKYDGRNRYRVITDGGKTILAKKILLATNVFTMHRKLLPSRIVPKFYASPQTVVMGEVDVKDLNKLSSLPSMVYHGQGGSSWYKGYPKNKDGNVHFYGSSVVEYPDGKHYVKIGHSDDILDGYLQLNQVSGWYSTGGDPQIVHHLTNLLSSMFTGLKFRSFKSDTCVTMVTATGRPYIDKISDNFGVAIGGNGHAAMSCDAIGHLAANMILDKVNMEEMSVLERCKLVTENSVTSKL